MRKLLESPEFQTAIKDLDSALKELANKQAAKNAGRNSSQDPLTEAALRDLLLQHQEARQSLRHPDTKEATVPVTHVAPNGTYWTLVGAGVLVASFALLLGRRLARRTPDSCGMPDGMIPNAELNRRGNVSGSVAATIQGFRSVNWEAVFPWRVAFSDKPWKILWVRWLLLFGLFPSVAGILCGERDDTKPLATVCVAGYVALFWVLGLRSVLKPSPLPASSVVPAMCAQVISFTFLLLLGTRVEWLNKVFAATASSSAFWRIAALLLVWTIAQAVLAGALLWWQQRISGATRLFYLGSISGMALAASPAVARYLDDDWFGSYRGASLAAFRSAPIPSLLSSMVVGLLTGGILAAVISLGKTNPLHSRRIAIVGTFAAACVMTLNSVALTTWAHPIVVAASSLGFVTYIRLMDKTAMTPQPGPNCPPPAEHRLIVG